jgi:hypothetical protein
VTVVNTPVGRAPDGKLLIAETPGDRAALALDDRDRDPWKPSNNPVGKIPVGTLEETPPLIDERGELTAGAFDGRTPDGPLLTAGTLDDRAALAPDETAPGRPSNIPVGKTPIGGLDVTPPLITERSELRPGAGDGRLGADEAPALMPEISELRAGTPVGRALDGRAESSDRSELNASALVGRMPVGRTDAPDCRALIEEMSELSAGALVGMAPDGKAES